MNNISGFFLFAKDSISRNLDDVLLFIGYMYNIFYVYIFFSRWYYKLDYTCTCNEGYNNYYSITRNDPRNSVLLYQSQGVINYMRFR